MSRSMPHRNVLFEAPPAQVLRSVDHARLLSLVPVAPRAAILAVMDELGVPVRTVCYECRLRSGDARVDVAVGLFPLRPAAIDDVLGRLGWRHRSDARWRRCLALLADWSSPGSPLAPRIPFACVAFDDPGEPATAPAPGLSLCVDPEFFARQLGLPTPHRVSATGIAALAGACYRRVHGEELPAASHALVERCLSDRRVIARHVSFMPSRTPATFKLDVRLPVDAIAALLERIAWPGDVPRVVGGIRQLMPWHGDVQLNLVLHPAQAESLEVELLTGRRQASTIHRRILLEKLVEVGHCDPAKADALRDTWVDPVSRDDAGMIVARSWYLKARFDRDGLAEAKAYVGLMPRARVGPRATRTAAPLVLQSDS